MIFNIATRWKIHICAQLHTSKIRHEQAIYYSKIFISHTGWSTIWKRIQSNNRNTKDWVILQATIGDTHTTALLYNKLSQYTETHTKHKSQYDYNTITRNSRNINNCPNLVEQENSNNQANTQLTL